MIENICPKCNNRARAINYKKNDKTYYRRLCDPCNADEKKKKKPKWLTQGYKKKTKCEACGFSADYTEQLTVYDSNNSFKTICLNCDAAVKITNKLEKKKSDLKPDF